MNEKYYEVIKEGWFDSERAFNGVRDDEMPMGVRREGGCEGVCMVVCRRLHQGKV